MLVLHKVFLFSLTSVLFLQTAAPSKQELNDQLYEAVRKGDVAAVTAALDRGADVNAKFRYGTTALFKAAERGNAQIAKILLDRGADVKVKDTFYGATAMTWAVDGKHVQVVRLLLEKGAEEVEDVLLSGVREGNADLVKAALDRGTLKPESLTVALAISSADEKNAAITEPVAATYLNNPAPEYPARARSRRQQGTVMLQVRVTEQGRPDAVEIFRSSGYESLDEAALDAVRQWKFVPARRGSQLVEASVVVPIQFRIN